MRLVHETEIRPPVIAGLDTREQLARALNVTPNTVWRWERRGLPVIRRGHLRLYDRIKVRAWLEDGQ
jgi:phage terminase Nu1 subunit (DNA packaging protein)